MWYKRLKRLRTPWQNLESSRHLLHHAKDHEGDGSGERAVAREQLFEALPEPGAYGAYFQLKHHTRTVLYPIFNINIIRPHTDIEY
jgi:hypothetical protein